MSARPNASIVLPYQRVAQLKAVAAIRGKTLSELFDAIVLEAIADEEIDDATPGFDITRQAGRVTLAVDGLGLPAWSATTTVMVADLFEREGGHGGKLTLQDGCSLAVSRMGRGVVVLAEDAVTGEARRVSITPALSKDIARQLYRAAYGK